MSDPDDNVFVESVQAIPSDAGIPVIGSAAYLSQTNFVSDEGYCLVFTRSMDMFELQIVGGAAGRHQLVMVQTNTDSMTEEAFDSEMEQVFTEEERENLLHKLFDAHIAYVLMYSKDKQRKYVYAILSVTLAQSESWANLHKIDVLLNAREAIRVGRSFKDFYLAERTNLEDSSDAEAFSAQIGTARMEYNKLPLSVWDHIHIPFNTDIQVRHPSIYQHFEPGHRIIHPRLFLAILFDMISSDVELGGAKYEYTKYMSQQKRPLAHFFALNADIQLRPSMSALPWLRPQSPQQLLGMVDDEIRFYFGEHIAFYFAFVVHYNKWLYGFSVLGTLWFIVQMSMGSIAVHGSTLIVVIAIFWSVFMIEHYYRRECQLRYKWGMLRFTSTEIPRPTFRGTFAISNSTAKIIETYSALSYYQHFVKIAVSMSTMVLCIAIVVSIMVGIWILRRKLGDNEYYYVLIGYINSLQIQIMNKIYTVLALRLNEWEQHRLEEEYYNHLVVKRVIFIVVNSFNSLFYIGFYQQYDSNTLRLEALRIQLVTLFCSAIVMNNLVEILLPWLYEKITEKRIERSENQFMEAQNEAANIELVSEAEAAAEEKDDDDYRYSMNMNMNMNMNNYDAQQEISSQALADIGDQIEKSDETFDVLANTAEIVVLHGYCILFVVVFPMMPLMALCNNFIEIRVDFYNLLNGQRPVPRGSPGIGVWKSVLSAFNLVAVFSNLALLCFRTNLISDLIGSDEIHNLLVFYFVACLVILFCIFVIRASVADQTRHTKDAINRQQNVAKYLLLEIQTQLNRMLSRQRTQLSGAQPEAGDENENENNTDI